MSFHQTAALDRRGNCPDEQCSEAASPPDSPVAPCADLPPVSNHILYGYRVFAKALSFFIFGLGSVVISIVCFPSMRLFLHPRSKFQKYARRLISASWRFFTAIMHCIRASTIEVDDPRLYRSLRSKIVVANHPSLLDVVMIISQIPNADCIVQSYLKRSILRLIASQLYILNDMNFDELAAACKKSLEQGNCLVIFPEGTRTRRNKPMCLERGFAHIALQTGCTIVPVHIGGTDKYGLGKRDPFFSYNPTERYIYRLRMQEEIPMQRYADLSRPRAVRHLTRDVLQVLSHPVHV